jgi:hypothetical protein
MRWSPITEGSEAVDAFQIVQGATARALFICNEGAGREDLTGVTVGICGKAAATACPSATLSNAAQGEIIVEWTKQQTAEMPAGGKHWVKLALDYPGGDRDVIKLGIVVL